MSDSRDLPPLPKGITLGQFAAWLQQAECILDPLPTEDDGDDVDDIEIVQALREWIKQVDELSEAGE